MRISDKMIEIQKLHGFNRVYQAECFLSEFSDVFGKNKGEQARYLKWLYTWLVVLDREGMRALALSKFEHLQDTENPRLHVIRDPHSKINERYIYIYEDGEAAIPLTVFMEKSSSDNKAAIIRAKNIFKELKEADDGTS